ncbi:MAG: DNA primase [Saprospiraceae bacterium]|nr:DNA primase [Saprospiraceae bacterium]
MITQKTINDVLVTSKIEEVVGDFMNLKRRGVNMIGNCPFHDEKTPSFTVSPSKNIYKCFGCGKGGDSVRFIMDHEKLSFPEAIRFLAAKYRIEIEETENTTQEIENKHITDSLYIVNEFARDYFVDSLFSRSEGKAIGLSYFKERGIREVTIKKFQLGYTTEERDDLIKKAIEKKYNIEHLRALGLVTKSDLDFFRSRVMFTIHNISGKVVAFAGRTLSSDKKQPKYINSPESEIYNKRAVLYGLYFAKEDIRRQDECILVEGYTDVITLHQGDIKNVVTSSVHPLTKEQIKLIKRYTQNIKIIYDGDSAGIKAALRGLDLVLESDMNVKLVLLPDGHDPDSFFTDQGTEAFNKYLNEKEEDFVFFKTRILLDETGDDPIKKTIVIRDIVGSIAKIPDAFKRALYIKQCSSMLQLSESMLNNEVNKSVKASIRSYKQTISTQDHSEKLAKDEEWLVQKTVLSEYEPSFIFNDAWQEKSICSILINFGNKWYDEPNKITIADFIIDNTKDIISHFDVGLYKRILEITIQEKNQGKTPDHNWYTSHRDEDIRDFAVGALSSPYVYASWESKEMFLLTQKMPEENYVRDATNALLRLQLRKSKKIIQELQLYFEKASDTEKESDEYIINLKVMQVVQKQRNEIAAKLGTVTF